MVDKLLSGEDVRDLVDEDVGILPYSKVTPESLDLYTNIYDNILILYQLDHSPNHITGHWTALKVLPNNEIAFYDSYGEEIDDQLDHIPKKYRKKSKQMKSTLANWLGNSKFDVVHYNPHKHQSRGNICGRLAGLFLKYGEEPEAFNDWIQALSGGVGVPIHDLSIAITDPLLPII